ncbi:hypothetical protein CSUB01_03095 [Colletotrichum sublineola]|uniref:Uncharacterized protein n=1 Tax=Colletotrichum sublineola TaxID=1173701 RepID=A0A066XSB1_COLSU|nr:hypothetical protein CSUB01_03095 [Colletotrichum sublineola]
MTARKTAHSSASSKRRTELTHSDFHNNPAGTHTSGSGSPTTQQQHPASGAFNPFQSFIATAHTPSPNTTIKRFVNIHPNNDMSKNYGAVAEKRSQRRAAEDGASLETNSSNTNQATKTIQVPRSSIARPIDTGAPPPSRLDGQRACKSRMSESVAKNSATTSTPPGGSRSFDSLPCVRTNRLPPMQLKTAPSALRSASASKRKRDSGTDSSSGLSTSDEIGRNEKRALLRMHERETNYGEAHTTAGAPTASQRSMGVSDSYSDVPQTQRRWNGPNMLRTRQKVAPDQQRGKMNCEERRLQLCATFNSAKFDLMIYGQAEATSPPGGVFVPAAPSNVMTNAQFSKGGSERLYMKLDPRIHWPHNRSDHWYNAKMEEIKSRGGRKANFGKAAKRMRQQRLEAERLEEEEKRASEQDLPVLNNKPPQPWSHHRHMDFGDVPEEELPAYVRKNPEWLQATAWMRENRAQNLRRNKEAAALRGAGLPFEHLFPRSRR